MTQFPNHSLYEAITHRTDTAPYSLHRTDVAQNTEPALYLHWHDEMEFLLLTQGSLRFHIEDREFLLKAGDGIFIPPGLLHSAEHADSEPIVFHAFVLSPEFIFPKVDTHNYNKYILPLLHNNLIFSAVLHPELPWQLDCLTQLRGIFTNGGELFTRGRTFLLWNQLYHNHIAPLLSEVPRPAQTNRLSHAVSFIEENYATNITLQELADLVHLSEGQFCRAFKDFTGMSPIQYLVRCRVLRSCTELLQTERKITDIALSCGFNNVSYYNRAFLKLMKMTPGQYRNTMLSFPT